MESVYANMFSSKGFQSDVAEREFDSITTELLDLSMMAPQFVEFQIPEKHAYLAKMREACGRHRVFMERLDQSDDPAAKEYLSATNAQLLAGGVDMTLMFEELEKSLQQYEGILREEEAVVSDPARHAEFRKALKEQWGEFATGKIDMANLFKEIDPAILTLALTDPGWEKAMEEIAASPSPETMQKWIDHPSIGPLVREMSKAMRAKETGA